MKKTIFDVQVRVEKPSGGWEPAECFFCRGLGRIETVSAYICSDCSRGITMMVTAADASVRLIGDAFLAEVIFERLGDDVCLELKPDRRLPFLPSDSENRVQVRLWGAAEGFGILSKGIASRSLGKYMAALSQNATIYALRFENGDWEKEDAARAIEEVVVMSDFYSHFFEAIGGTDESLSDIMSGGAK